MVTLKITIDGTSVMREIVCSRTFRVTELYEALRYCTGPVKIYTEGGTTFAEAIEEGTEN